MNGAMDFWQRGTSAASTSVAPTYSADRFKNEVGGGTSVNINSSRQTSVPDANLYSYSLRSIRVSGTGNSEANQQQRVESYLSSTLVGKQATFSVWVKLEAGSSAAFLRALVPTSSSKDTWGARALYSDVIIATQNITIDNTWQKFSITFTVPAGGVNGLTVLVQHNNTATNDGFSTTGWQLEEGASSSNFERAGGSLMSDLLLCQRYYETNGVANPATYNHQAAKVLWIPYNSYKRVSPAVSCTGLSSGSLSSIYQAGPEGFNINATGTTAGNAFYFDWTADAEL